MTLASDFSAVTDDLYEYAGIECIYTDRNGDTTTVTAIIDYSLQEYGTVADVSGKIAVISVRISELADRPRRGETYTIYPNQSNEATYTVDSIVRADELEHAALVA